MPPGNTTYQFHDIEQLDFVSDPITYSALVFLFYGLYCNITETLQTSELYVHLVGDWRTVQIKDFRDWKSNVMLHQN